MNKKRLLQWERTRGSTTRFQQGVVLGIATILLMGAAASNLINNPSWQGSWQNSANAGANQLTNSGGIGFTSLAAAALTRTNLGLANFDGPNRTINDGLIIWAGTTNVVVNLPNTKHFIVRDDESPLTLMDISAGASKFYNGSGETLDAYTREGRQDWRFYEDVAIGSTNRLLTLSPDTSGLMTITASGNDSNIGIRATPKGTGVFSVGTAASNVTIKGDGTITPSGSDTDIGIHISPKGVGEADLLNPNGKGFKTVTDGGDYWGLFDGTGFVVDGENKILYDSFGDTSANWESRILYGYTLNNGANINIGSIDAFNIFDTESSTYLMRFTGGYGLAFQTSESGSPDVLRTYTRELMGPWKNENAARYLVGGYATSTPTTGFSIVFGPQTLNYLTPAGTLATGTGSLPDLTNSATFNNNTVGLVSTQNVTAFTLNVQNGGTILGTSTTAITANTYYEWKCLKTTQAGAVWIRTH